jgi:protein-S-isoprenylcysteine O-methyltransferase Ste14
LAEHPHRADLTGEHRLGDAGQLVLAILFSVVWALDSFVLRYTSFLNDHVPVWVRAPLGAAFIAVAAYLAWDGLSLVFGEQRETPRVIREGVFSWVRHPIYLGEVLLYLGLLMLSLSVAAIAVWLAGLGFLHIIARFEEQLLVARFGDEYRCYMEDVPMWLPRMRGR